MRPIAYGKAKRRIGSSQLASQITRDIAAAVKLQLMPISLLSSTSAAIAPRWSPASVLAWVTLDGGQVFNGSHTISLNECGRAGGRRGRGREREELKQEGNSLSERPHLLLN